MIVGRDRDLDPGRNRLGHLALKRQNVPVVAVVPLGPKLGLIADLDELGRDPQPLSRAADAALQYVIGPQLPADLPDETVTRVQELAVRTFQVLCCEGMARVDVFLKADGELVVNEINTIPGFTRISMYPKLWDATGVSYTELIDRLIQLAIKRYEREQKLKTSFDF